MEKDVVDKKLCPNLSEDPDYTRPILPIAPDEAAPSTYKSLVTTRSATTDSSSVWQHRGFDGPGNLFPPPHLVPGLNSLSSWLFLDKDVPDTLAEGRPALLSQKARSKGTFTLQQMAALLSLARPLLDCPDPRERGAFQYSHECRRFLSYHNSAEDFADAHKLGLRTPGMPALQPVSQTDPLDAVVRGSVSVEFSAPEFQFWLSALGRPVEGVRPSLVLSHPFLYGDRPTRGAHSATADASSTADPQLSAVQPTLWSSRLSPTLCLADGCPRAAPALAELFAPGAPAVSVLDLHPVSDLPVVGMFATPDDALAGASFPALLDAFLSCDALEAPDDEAFLPRDNEPPLGESEPLLDRLRSAVLISELDGPEVCDEALRELSRRRGRRSKLRRLQRQGVQVEMRPLPTVITKLPFGLAVFHAPPPFCCVGAQTARLLAEGDGLVTDTVTDYAPSLAYEGKAEARATRLCQCLSVRPSLLPALQWHWAVAPAFFRLMPRKLRHSYNRLRLRDVRRCLSRRRRDRAASSARFFNAASSGTVARREKSTTQRLCESGTLESARMDWVEAALQLCRQGWEILTLMLHKRGLVYMHLDYNFNLRPTKTLSTKERKRSRLGNAFNLTRQLLRMLKIVADLHVAYRQGRINSGQLADAVTNFFNHIGHATEIYRHKYHVMRQITDAKALHTILNSTLRGVFTGEQQGRLLVPGRGVPAKQKAGCAVWLWNKALWDDWLRGIVPMLTQWMGDHLRHVFGQREIRDGQLTITKQRSDAHFDLELRANLLREVQDVLPGATAEQKGGHAKRAVRQMTEAWRCWKAGVPFAPPDMPEPVLRVIERNVAFKADWYLRHTIGTRRDYLLRPQTDKLAVKRNLSRVLRLWMRREAQRQKEHVEKGPQLVVTTDEAIRLYRCFSSFIQARGFKPIEFPAAGYKHDNQILVLALERIRQKYSLQIKLSGAARAELTLVEEAFDRPVETLNRIKQFLLQRRSFKPLTVTLSDHVSFAEPAYSGDAWEQLCDSYLDAYLEFEAHERGLWPTWIKPCDDELPPVTLHRWLQAIASVDADLIDPSAQMRATEQMGPEYAATLGTGVWDLSSGPVVHVEASIDHLFSNCELTVLNYVLRSVMAAPLASYIVARCNCEVQTKDITVTNHIGIPRGLRFGPFLTSLWGLVADVALLGPTRALDLAGTCDEPVAFGDPVSDSAPLSRRQAAEALEETERRRFAALQSGEDPASVAPVVPLVPPAPLLRCAMRRYMRWGDRVYCLLKPTADEAAALEQQWLAHMEPGEEASACASFRLFTADWPVASAMVPKRRDVYLARSVLWDLASRLPRVCGSISYSKPDALAVNIPTSRDTLVSVYSISNPALFLTLSGFAVRMVPHCRTAQAVGLVERLVFSAGLESGRGVHSIAIAGAPASSVWPFMPFFHAINPDSLDAARANSALDGLSAIHELRADCGNPVGAFAALRVSGAAIEEYQQRIQQVMLSTAATTFMKVASKWNSSILAFVALYREAIAATPAALDAIVKAEAKIRARVMSSLNSKMPDRFPPVVFYTPVELGGLGLLSAGHVSVPADDLRYSQYARDERLHLFRAGIREKDEHIPTLLQYVQPWRTEIQDSGVAWRLFLQRQSTAQDQRQRLSSAEVADLADRGLPRIATQFYHDRDTLSMDHGWRWRAYCKKWQSTRVELLWWTHQRHDGKLWSLDRYRSDVVAALGGVDGILRHTLFGATGLPTWEGVLWQAGTSSYEATMQFRRLTHAQRLGLNQIQNRRFVLWWSTTINRADVYIGFETQLELCGVRMHGKLPTLKTTYIQLFHAHLWQKTHESIVVDLIQALEQRLDALSIASVEKLPVHPRKSYQFQSSEADILIIPSAIPGAFESASGIPVTRVAASLEHMEHDADYAPERIGGQPPRAERFWVDVQLRWGTYDSHDSAEAARRAFQVYTSDGVSMYPSKYGVVVSFDLAYGTYSAYGHFFPGLRSLLRDVLAKVEQTDPAISTLRDRVRRALDLRTANSTTVRLTASSMRELFASPAGVTPASGASFGGHTLLVDDSQVLRLVFHRTPMGKLKASPVNGALLVMSPLSGRVVVRIIHADSVFANQKRRAQLARWKSAEEITALFRALPPEDRPSRVVASRTGVMEALPTLLLEMPQIVLIPTDLQLPLGIACDLIEDRIKAATQPETVVLNLYDDWVRPDFSLPHFGDGELSPVAPFTAFHRLMLILRARRMAPYSTSAILAGFKGPEEAFDDANNPLPARYPRHPNYYWPSLTPTEWQRVEVSLRDLVVATFCTRNAITDPGLLTETEVQMIIINGQIAVPEELKSDYAGKNAAES